jgi:hypothetical protein
MLRSRVLLFRRPSQQRRALPATITAGTGGSFTATALNADGSVNTGYTGTVHFTSSDPRAVLPADYTFTPSDAGVHNFTATLDTAGTQSITATDTTTPNINGTDGPITVNPAAASHLSVSAPASVTKGKAFSVTVTALDPYNNVATGYRGTVHFTSSDRNATLPANYTFAAADNGAHTFTNKVTLKTLGTQTVTATDTVTGSITGSASISVVSGPAIAAPLLISAQTNGSVSVFSFQFSVFSFQCSVTRGRRAAKTPHWSWHAWSRRSTRVCRWPAGAGE